MFITFPDFKALKVHSLHLHKLLILKTLMFSKSDLRNGNILEPYVEPEMLFTGGRGGRLV